ncbi:MAG: hypothetical protein HFE59_09430 [Clostridiales bacterium]|nr:hypothetical protein [Clostridiales bacterium]
MYKDRSVKFKTNYGELGYIGENKFAVFKKYHTYGLLDKNREEECDIIDVNGNIIEKTQMFPIL